MTQEELVFHNNKIYNYLLHTQKACKMGLVKEGLEFNSMVEDLLNKIDLDQLVDIRENSAYISFVQLIGGYINFEEDGYEILAKEYKRELKYSGGNLIEIQLKEMIDRSIRELLNFFESFPCFETFLHCFDEDSTLFNRILNKSKLCCYKPDNIDNTIKSDDVYIGLPTKRQLTAVENIEFTKSGHTINEEYNPPKEEIKDLQQYIPKIARSVSYYEENEFDTTLHIPEFILNDYVFCPIIDLFLKINKQSLNLDKSEDDIVTSIIEMIDDTIECLNTFCRPEFTKINIISEQEFETREKEEVEMKRLTFVIPNKENEFEDSMFLGFDQDIYSKYIGRIKLVESEKNEKEI